MLWRHQYLWRHITAKVKPRSPKSFSKKMISIKLSFNWGVHHLFSLILFFNRMGRLGQIGSIQTLCKISTLGTEIKKYAGGTFQSTRYQSRLSKKLFLEGIFQLSIMVWPTNRWNLFIYLFIFSLFNVDKIS